METPIYLFTGFLDAGKTTFIQSTLEDDRFNKGENTLLLLCEDGEEEYNPEQFSGKRVFIETVSQPEELTPAFLESLCKKHACQRVLVEYNGMWKLDSLYSALPKDWMVYQELMFCNAETLFLYNDNMRELVVDKLMSCELVIFNRAKPELDRLAVHQMVRAVSRRAEIAYEDADGNVSYDEIPDELPYDINADTIELTLDDYATWYRDISEEMDKYQGKTISLSGTVVKRKDLPEDNFIFGREMMTCCADDISFAGVLCRWKDAKALKDRDWVQVTAQIGLEDHKLYGRRGPVFAVESVTRQSAPKNTVATFY